MQDKSGTVIDVPIVDMLVLRRDLYFLMSLLLADKEVAKVKNVVDWTQTLYENEVRRLMLWVSAASRSLLDLQDRRDIGRQDCGEYWADFPGGEKESLLFRRACNTAIHAKEIWPFKVPLRKPKIKIKPGERESKIKIKLAYNGRMTIRGEYDGKKTRAHLDMVEFVRIADALINSFEDENDANV